MTDRAPDDDAALLASLTRLTVRWSSADFQRRVSETVGLDLDDSAIRAVYVVGLLGTARASTIADELHLTRPTASKLFSRLERAHLVQRSYDEHDARARNVSLTDLGQDAFVLLVDAGVEMVRAATTGWSAADRRRFAALLEEFVDQLVDERALASSGAGTAPQNRAETPPPGKEE